MTRPSQPAGVHPSSRSGAVWVPCLICLGVVFLTQVAQGESFIHASTADAAATYNVGNGQFSRQRLADGGINVGGQGGSSGFLQAVVFPFQLPDFGPVADPFETAEFIFRLSNKENASAFNVDLYALPARAGSAVLPTSASTTNRGDFFMGGFQSGPADDNAPGVVKLQDNILVPSTPTGLVPTSHSGSAQLAAYLNAAYDGGNGADRWVFLRLSADAVTGGAHRYSISSADNSTPDFRPRIRYNFVPEPETLYTRIGTDPTFQQLIDSGVIVPGVSQSTTPVLGSAINVNHPLLEQQTGVTGPIAQPIRIHTQVNSSVLRSNFPNFTRWYQEDGNVQVMRLFQGEQNVRSGVGSTGTPGRIEAFFPNFTVASGTWSVWEGTYTLVDPLGSTIFQLFHDGGQLWAFHLGMSSSGDISFNRRNNIPGLPSRITVATNMVGKSISFRIRANGSNYEIYKKIPQVDDDWELVTVGSYTRAVDNRISFRWGMYVGSQAGRSIPKDGLLFVSGVNRSTSTAPGVDPPPPPPPPVTYYWDNNGAAAGFGTAGGVWGETTSGDATQGWSTDASGGTLPDDVSTFALDPVFFGTNASGGGLGGGTITISDTVTCADLSFGSQSGNITLAGGEIFQEGNRTITVAGTGKTHTIRSELSGFGTRTIGGSSTLQLYGENSFVESLTIGDNTNSNLRVRFNTITDVDGGPSSLGAPLTAGNGVIQIGSVSHGSTMEFTNASAAQTTDRRIRVGSSSNGSGGAAILNNNSDPDHTLTFTNSSFNTAATGISTTNRILTLGGSNSGDNTIQGAIIDNVGTSGGRVRLTKSGNGTWVLSGANTYSNGTTLSGGLLKAAITQTASALGTGSVSVGAGSTLLLDNQSTTNVANVPLIGNVFTGSGLLRLQFSAGPTARNTYLPNVTGFGGTLQLSNTGITGDKWNATHIGTVAASVVVDSGSTIFLSGGSNSFTNGITLSGPGNSEGRGAIRVGGATTVLGGDIRLAGDSTIGMENAVAQITGNISSGAVGTQTLTLGGTQGSQVGGTLSGDIGGGTGTLHLTVANGSYNLSGNLSHGGGVSVAGGLLTLSGPANTYSGPTTVAEGTLALVGAGMTSPISVASGASLAFTLGSPATSTSSVDLANGTVKITGTVDGASDYPLMTASGGIIGTPMPDVAIPGYQLEVRNGGTTLVLAFIEGDAGGYASWAAIHAGGQGPGEDFDGDGVQNGIEYVLGGTATTNDSDKLPTLAIDGENSVFSFIRDQSSIDGSTVVTIKAGNNLVDWPYRHPVPETAVENHSGLSVIKDSPAAGWDTVIFTMPLEAGERRFYQLHVSIPSGAGG